VFWASNVNMDEEFTSVVSWPQS